MTPVKSTHPQHGATINDLADRGLIQPVEFIAPDGIPRVANSMWAAHDWIKATGYYQRPGSPPIVYRFDLASVPTVSS